MVPADVDSFIIDSELVAYDTEAKKILPFQTLSKRSRKHVTKEDLDNKVAIFAFDILFLNGESLLDKTLLERRNLLREKFPEIEGKFHYAVSSDTNDFEEIDKFLQLSIKDGCEGLMVKTL